MSQKSQSWLLGLLLLVWLAPAAYAADEPAPAWQGVWRGTIGALPVQACLDHRDYADQGAYYYLSHLTIIHLSAIDKPGAAKVWSEAAVSDEASGPLWVLAPPRGDSLAGEWQSRGKTLPIRLTRVPSPGDSQGPCGSLAFSAPRVTPITVTRKPAVKDGVAYTRLIANVGKQFDATLESFEMPAATPADVRVNTALRKRIPNKGQGAEYLDCMMGSLDSNGYDGGYSDIATPTMITRHWLVWTDASETDCGGAHPDQSLTTSVFDRQTGEAVNLWRWFTPAAVTRDAPEGGADEAFEITPALLRVILARWRPADPDCRQAYEDQTFWDVALTRRGFGFTPMLPHVAQACAEQVVVPYPAASPFLSAAGRAGVASVLVDLR